MLKMLIDQITISTFINEKADMFIMVKEGAVQMLGDSRGHLREFGFPDRKRSKMRRDTMRRDTMRRTYPYGLAYPATSA
jgi:hypothetical protein